MAEPLVWLPLDGSLRNLGLAEVDMVNNSATTDANGKIGQCYYFNGNTWLKGTSDFTSISNKASICFWFKMETLISNTQLVSIGTNSGWNNIRMGVVVNSSGSITGSVSDGSSNIAWNFATTIAANRWYHYALVYDAGTLFLYLDGVFVKSLATTIVPSVADTPTFGVGAASNGAEKSHAWINDVRIYDTALSAMEVYEISKGLILHFPLNDPLVANLIPNGTGQDGALHWASAPDTTNIPSDSTTKGSYTGNNWSSEFIPIHLDHTYFCSEYLKTTGSTSGNTYPSFQAYDYDKKPINNYNSRVGFNTATLTTLSQALKPGDTVVYATNLSAWTQNTTDHYYYVAVFGYKDSRGYEYPALTYTADSLSFGSQTDKSNLDKTNNKITLKAAYTGAERPAGTSICQATAGSTYWYPYGGVALSSISDWTLKTREFVPKNEGRLLAASYIRYMAYPNAYHADIKLYDQTMKSDVIYDSSGYHHDGILYNTAYSSQDTARNDYCLRFLDPDVSTYSTLSGAYIKAPLQLSGHDAITFVWWGNHRGGYGGGWHGIFSTSSNESVPSDYSVTTANHRDNAFDVCNASGTVVRAGANMFVANEWHQYALVYNGANVLTYRDGTQITTHALTGALKPFGYLYLNISCAGGAWRGNNSYMSDFRVYTTALSVDDLNELRKVGGSVDDKEKFHTYDFIEDRGDNLVAQIVAKSANGTILDDHAVQWDFSNSVDTYFFFHLARPIVSTQTYWVSFDVEGLADGDNVAFGIPQNQTYGDFKLHNGHNVGTLTNCSYNAGTNLAFDDYARSSTQTVTLTNFRISESEPIPEVTKAGITTANDFSDGSEHTASIFNSGDISAVDLIEI